MTTANRVTLKPGSPRNAAERRPLRFFEKNEIPSKLLILDSDLIHELIAERQRHGTDKYDEVWEGVYIVPPLATLVHQDLLVQLCVILFQVVNLEKRGQVYPGANISDRRIGWKKKFRAPDVVVVLQNTAAVDCRTHLMNGPDFLVEIQSPGDQTEEKIPFYEKIKVRELLIIQRDTRELKLLRHDGEKLIPVEPSAFKGGKWLVSSVVSLAFRRKKQRGAAQIEVQRTDDTPGNWTV
jgi:Uma2 family endonuclease